MREIYSGTAATCPWTPREGAAFIFLDSANHGALSVLIGTDPIPYAVTVSKPKA